MKLAELRKLAIRKQVRIRFGLRNGMECVITEHGVAQVPGLKGIPDFNLEEELASAATFVLDPAAAGKKSAPPRPAPIGRDELAGMASAAPAEASPHEED